AGLHRRENVSDSRRMGAKAVAAVDQRDCFRGAAQLLRPVERRVAAADDDDTLAAKLLQIENAILNSLPVPRLCDRLWQPARRECSDSSRKHQRPGRKTVGAGDEDEVPVVLLESGYMLIEMHRLAELGRLAFERAHQILCQHLGKAGDVEYVFLRIKGRQLAAGLR